MTMRTMAAVALVVLASTLWTGAVQIIPSAAAPPGQLGMLRAGIYPGSCANPEPAAIIDLGALAPLDPEGGPSSPLVSYIETPLAITDLRATPNAIVASLGGDVDAAIACGELGGDESGRIAVTLREENNSGFAGVALLTAAGEHTRITIVLAEVPLAPTIATPLVIPGTPEPVGVTPTPTRAPGGETPPAQTPAIIPVRPPSLQTPPALTPTPTPAATDQGALYQSARFGYAIAYGPPWQVTGGPEVDATSDYIKFSNGTSVIDFLGLAEGLTAPDCMDRLYESIRTLPGVRSLVSRASSPLETLTTTAELASEAWDVTYRNDAGRYVDSTVYARCSVLEPGQSILVTTHEAPRDQYEEQVALREAFYAGVTLP